MTRIMQCDVALCKAKHYVNLEQLLAARTRSIPCQDNFRSANAAKNYNIARNV